MDSIFLPRKNPGGDFWQKVAVITPHIIEPTERIIVKENEEITFTEAILPAAVITVLALARYLAWEKMSDYFDRRSLRKIRERVNLETDKARELFRKLGA